MSSILRHRTSAFLVLGLACGTGAVSFARQDPPAQQQPPARTVSVGSDTVSLDFLVLSRDGTPILDLKPEDVRVTIGGKQRALKSLQLVTPPGASPATAAAPGVTATAAPGAATQPASAGGEASTEPPPPPYGTNAMGDAGRSIVLVVDDETMRPNNEGPMRTAVASFVDLLAPGDQVALITVPRGSVRTNFTTNHDLIKQEVTRIMGQAEQRETFAQASCRTLYMLGALTGAIDTLARGVGPTTFVVFTSSLVSEQLSPTRAASANQATSNIGECDLRAEEFQKVGFAAAAARANFYFIQHDAAVGSSGGGDSLRAGIDNLASVTGGHVNWAGRIDEALARVARETSAYYVATFQPEPGERTGNSLQVKVSVARPNTEVRVRPDMMIPKASDPSATRASAANPQQLLVDSRVHTELPIRVAGFAFRHQTDQLKVIAHAEIVDPTGTIQGASAGLIDQAGRLIAQGTAQPAETGRRYVSLALLAPAGTYRLRMAVVDAAGQRGTAEYEVSSELVPAGPLRMSSLVLGLSRPAPGTENQFMFIPTLEFKDQSSVVAQFEVYSSERLGPTTHGIIEIAPTLNGRRLFAMPAVVAPTSLPDMFTVTATIPIGVLEPGDYVIRAIMGVDGHPEGRIVRTLRKTR
jgi:VWFA-related protein